MPERKKKTGDKTACPGSIADFLLGFYRSAFQRVDFRTFRSRLI
jgi:hypothetical protein